MLPHEPLLTPLKHGKRSEKKVGNAVAETTPRWKRRPLPLPDSPEQQQHSGGGIRDDAWYEERSRLPRDVASSSPGMDYVDDATASTSGSHYCDPLQNLSMCSSNSTYRSQSSATDTISSLSDDGRVHQTYSTFRCGAHRFLVLRLTVKESSQAAYTKSRRVYDHLGFGQATVFGLSEAVNASSFASSASAGGRSCSPAPQQMSLPGAHEGSPLSSVSESFSSVSHVPFPFSYGSIVGSVNGLRKMASIRDAKNVQYALSISREPAAYAYAVEAMDGVQCVVSSFRFEDLAYWIVGCEEGHLILVWNEEGEEGSGGAEEPPLECDLTQPSTGGANTSTTSSAAGSTLPTSSGSLTYKLAMLWKALLRRMPLTSAAQLHHTLATDHLTLCGSASIPGWERLLANYRAAAQPSSSADVAAAGSPHPSTAVSLDEEDEEGHADDHNPILVFHAVTQEEDTPTKVCMNREDTLLLFRLFELPHVVPSSECKASDNAEMQRLLIQPSTDDINRAGAYLHLVNQDHHVIRMLHMESIAITLERAAQEWVLCHRSCGGVFEGKMDRKLATLRRSERLAGRLWRDARLAFLIVFSSWLFSTHRLSPSSGAGVVREIRGTWLSLQHQLRLEVMRDENGEEEEEIVEASSHSGSSDDTTQSSSISDGDDICAPTPEVILLTGPQGCGKSTIARAVVWLLMHSGQKPYWLNQDEVGSRSQCDAIMRRLLASSQYTHLLVDRMHLTRNGRMKCRAKKPLLTIAWYHPEGPPAFAETCFGRVMDRKSHRTLRIRRLSRGGSGTPVTPASSPSLSPSTPAGTVPAERRPTHTEGSKVMEIIKESVLAYDITLHKTPLNCVLLDVTHRPQQALASVWEHLSAQHVNRSFQNDSSNGSNSSGMAALLPCNDELCEHAVRCAEAFESLMGSHYHHNWPRQAVLRATNPTEVLSLVPSPLLQHDKKRSCEICEVEVYSFASEFNPVVLVFYASQQSKAFSLALRRVIADERLTILEVGSPSSSTSIAALLELPSWLPSPDRLLIPVAASIHRRVPAGYPKDLYHRAVVKSDPFCTVCELRSGAESLFSYQLLD